MSEKNPRPADPISRAVFATPIRFPDVHGTELSSWSAESHSARCTCELGAGNAVILRGPRGTTLVPAARVVYVEMWRKPEEKE